MAGTRSMMVKTRCVAALPFATSGKKSCAWAAPMAPRKMAKNTWQEGSG